MKLESKVWDAATSELHCHESFKGYGWQVYGICSTIRSSTTLQYQFSTMCPSVVVVFSSHAYHCSSAKVQALPSMQREHDKPSLSASRSSSVAFHHAVSQPTGSVPSFASSSSSCLANSNTTHDIRACNPTVISTMHESERVDVKSESADKAEDYEMTSIIEEGEDTAHFELQRAAGLMPIEHAVGSSAQQPADIQADTRPCKSLFCHVTHKLSLYSCSYAE